jgi:hypothetical protein
LTVEVKISMLSKMENPHEYIIFPTAVTRRYAHGLGMEAF